MSDRPATAAGPSRDVERYSDALWADVLVFQSEAYPARRPEWVEPRWRWMFLESARRLGVAPMVWLCRDETGVVGQRGAIAVALHTSAGAVVTGWCVDTIVLERRRGEAIGSLLVARATADLPVSLSLGQTAHIRALQARYGWHPVATMDCWLMVLDPRHAFRGRLRSPVPRALVAGAAWAWQRLRGGARRLMSPRPRFAARTVTRFDAAHDRLWERVRGQYGCAVVRDASYLNWKYVAQPGQQFRRLEVHEGDHIGGLCIWTLHEPDGSHVYRRAWIIDMVVDHADGAAVTALLDAVADAAHRAGADVLEFDLLGRDLARHLRRAGWIRGAQTRQLRVSTHGAEEDMATLLRSPDAWYVTRGDSDGDHPWWTPAGQRRV